MKSSHKKLAEKTLNIQVPLERFEEIQAEALRQGLPRSQFVRRTLFAKLDEMKRVA